MDTLRISLILAGIAVLAVVYLWSRRQTMQRTHISRREPVLDVAAGDFVVTQEPMLEPALEQPGVSETQQEAEELREQKFQIVSLLVLAKNQQKLRGAPLVQSANRAGLRFGEMSIFHHHVAERAAPLYSMANVIEPGTFDLATLETFVTPGVVLFMNTGEQENKVVALDAMMRAAKQLSRELNAQVCNAQREPMDADQLERWYAETIAQMSA
ncbi:MAG: cell division protein ZipA [Pseudomonadota bacterium]